jgi:hypothetical protein
MTDDRDDREVACVTPVPGVSPAESHLLDHDIRTVQRAIWGVGTRGREWGWPHPIEVTA